MTRYSKPARWHVSLILLAVGMSGLVSSSGKAAIELRATPIEAAQLQLSRVAPPSQWLRSEVSSTLDQSATSEPGGQRPGLAFLLSAALPGAGQLYNGNRRGYLYMGLELGAWFVRTSYIDAGNKKEGDSETYARRHWSYDRFFESRGDDGCLFTAEGDSLIREYAANDIEQFYTELDRTDTYRCGWDDFAESYDPDNPGVLSPRRDEYRKRIDKSNSLKSRADFALGLIVVNRVVSAVDAFRVARSRQEGKNPSLRLHSSIEGSWSEPRAVFRLTKELR